MNKGMKVTDHKRTFPIDKEYTLTSPEWKDFVVKHISETQEDEILQGDIVVDGPWHTIEEVDGAKVLLLTYKTIWVGKPKANAFVYCVNKINKYREEAANAGDNQ